MELPRRRVLWALFLFLAVTVVTYVIFFVTPADPAKLAGGEGRDAGAGGARRARTSTSTSPSGSSTGSGSKQLVIDQSLGESFVNRQDVNDIVRGRRARHGLARVRRRRLLADALDPDRRHVGDQAALDASTGWAMVFVLIGISAHPVWIGLIFAYVFGYGSGGRRSRATATSSTRRSAPECGGPVQWAYHMILPWATFAILFAALYVRLIRANVMETMNEDYVRTARAKGAPERRVMRSHILRNSMLPVVTILGMDIGLALGGAIFTESIYGLPGLGRRDRSKLRARPTCR